MADANAKAVPIATRQLRTASTPSRSVVVRLFAPQQEGNNWSCVFEIATDRTEQTRAFGVDSMQALQMAIEGIRVTLQSLPEPLVWLDELGFLGFPMSVSIAWGLSVQRALEAKLIAEEAALVGAALENRRKA